jgi:hypothetical protein
LNLHDEAGTITRRNVFLCALTLVTALSMTAILRVRSYAAAIDSNDGPQFYKILTYEVPPGTLAKIPRDT